MGKNMVHAVASALALAALACNEEALMLPPDGAAGADGAATIEDRAADAPTGTTDAAVDARTSAMDVPVAALDTGGGGDGGAATCKSNGRTFAVGPVPDIEKCNTCSCLPDGSISCTKRGCPEASVWRCYTERTYRYFSDGGRRVYREVATLAPWRDHVIRRESVRDGMTSSCVRDLRCPSDMGVGLNEVLLAIDHPDVKEALAQAMPPHHGSDPRPFDGSIFVFERDDKRGFTLGPGTVPAGLRALEQLLTKLHEQTLAAPECAQLPR